MGPDGATDYERADHERTDHESTADLVARAVDHGILHQALELAVVVARSGAEARPPIPPPGSLRPLLRHTKWTARARSNVARALDTDEEFRSRVAEAAEELDVDQLGTASRLWLVRPEGWREDLADAVAELDAAAEAREADREEQRAKRQLGELRAEMERRREETEAAVRRAGEAESELAEARREKREAAARADELDVELRVARGELARSRTAALEAESLAGEQRRALEAALQEAEELRAEEARLRERIAELQRALTEADTRQVVDEAAAADLRQTVARAVGEAATAAAALGEALGAAARSLVEQGSLPADTPLPTNHAPYRAGAGLPAAPTAAIASLDPEPAPPRAEDSSVPAPGAGTRRQPRPLPPAVFDDSPEAAVHLVRSGVLLLVDGYNVSLFAWPELPLPAQRHRVTTSLAELAARTGAAVRVIFDGDEQVAYPDPRGEARSPVRVTFSTPGVDADEVIIGLVDEHPQDRPVVVATNDRRVQDEVRQRGANVLTTEQLLGLVRRSGSR